MKIYLANPRGFCAGVDRAIDIVDLSLKKYGAPIYVRHEIVHSRHVVNSLRTKGAVFVEELGEVPEGSVVIFSAHGVSKSVWDEANRRRLHVFDDQRTGGINPVQPPPIRFVPHRLGDSMGTEDHDRTFRHLSQLLHKHGAFGTE